MLIQTTVNASHFRFTPFFEQPGPASMIKVENYWFSIEVAITNTKISEHSINLTVLSSLSWFLIRMPASIDEKYLHVKKKSQEYVLVSVKLKRSYQFTTMVTYGFPYF